MTTALPGRGAAEISEGVLPASEGVGASEARLRRAISQSRWICGLQDAQLRYVWLAVAGRAVPHAPGHGDADLFEAQSAALLLSLKQEVLRTGRPIGDRRWLEWEGERRLLELRIEPLFDDAGTLVELFVEACDRTDDEAFAHARERLFAEREIERSWLLAVIERSPIGILLIERLEDGEHTTANERAAELLGHPIDAANARKVISGRLLSPDGAALSFDELPSSRALRGERITLEEFLLRRMDGSTIPLLLSAGPILDAERHEAGAVVTFDDASMLKELERLREQWTSIVTHDLRQPITSIAGFASVLAAHPDMPEHLRGKLRHIVAAARRLGRMTTDLLEISRLESAQLDLQRQPTEIGALVADVVERFTPELERFSMRIVRHAEEATAAVDPERFEQILFNLLSNAAKYGTPGTEIVVEVERREGEVVVGITNEGEGVPADQLQAIFARWHRGPEARRAQVRGMGLGLYIARGLVEAHGGRIWAETEPGKTITFRLSIPIEEPSG